MPLSVSFVSCVVYTEILARVLNELARQRVQKELDDFPVCASHCSCRVIALVIFVVNAQDGVLQVMRARATDVDETIGRTRLNVPETPTALVGLGRRCFRLVREAGCSCIARS